MVKFKPSMLKSTTLEGAFLEAVFLLEKIEGISNIAKKEAKKAYDQLSEDQKSGVPLPLTGWDETSFFSISIDSDQQRCVVLANLPSRVKENSFGGYFLAKEIFPDNEIGDIEDFNLDKLLESL